MAIATPLDLIVRIALFVAIVVITFVTAKVFRSFIRTLHLPSSFSLHIQQIGFWAIILFGLLFALSQVGVDITTLLILVGLLCIFTMIALRDVLSNWGAGYLLSTYKPFNVGDWVQIGTYYGHVIETNPMHIVLVSPNNEIIRIPNSSIVREVVVNRTASGELKVSVPVVVDRSCDLSWVEEELLKIEDKIRHDLVPNSKLEVIITKIGSEQVEMQLQFNISNPAKKDSVTSTVLKEIKKILDELKKKR